MRMNVEYRINEKISTQAFVDLLNASGLGKRRPVDDLSCMQAMIENANLTISAWEEDQLIGIARSVTDFSFACYLSDLAVDKRCQGLGIGKELQRLTQAQLGPKCKLILLAAPDANDYYPKIGYENNPRCWVISSTDKIG